jgi:site-specific recombinase XerD
LLNQHGRPLSVAGVQYRLKHYRHQAGLDLTCHQLRHTFARRLAEHEMPLDSLAKLLGHSDLQTTQRYIDGADPTVRRDFEQAMHRLAPQPDLEPIGDRSAASPLLVAAIQAAPAERPEAEAVLANLSHLTAALPDWLAPAVRQHTLRRMARWQPHRVKKQTYFHLNSLRRVCQWLVTQRAWTELAQLHRTDLVAYVNSRLADGLKPTSIEAELSVFRMFWRDLLDQEQVTNGAILTVKAPEAGQPLPRYLTATEFQRLLHLLQRETQADPPEDRLTLAWFYLLAHAGLRSCELLNLRLPDCDLTGKRLHIRGGKGNQDRVVPMTDHLVTVIQAYRVVREAAPTNHLLIYRGAALNYSLIAARLRVFGQKAEIESLTSHRFRHTLATMLVNQGMPIVSLQKFLGHQDINMTLIYAKVFDETVRQQFAAAMAQIESIAVANWPIQFGYATETSSISTLEISDSV